VVILSGLQGFHAFDKSTSQFGCEGALDFEGTVFRLMGFSKRNGPRPRRGCGSGSDAAQEVESFESVQIMAGSFAVDLQRTGHFAKIKSCCLSEGESRTTSRQQQGCSGDAELGQVALDVASDEIS
jgi:hypothetical protein